jgi:RsiW-degrading membrane proteinase PrsW (M82 family)
MTRRVWRYQRVIRIRKWKNDRQHNGQKKKDKRKNNDLQSITHKTKERVTRTPLKTRCELRCSGRVSSSCSIRRNIFFEKVKLYKTQYDGLTSRSNNQLIQHIYISFHIIILLILLLYCSCLWSRNCSPYRSTWVHTWFLVGFVLLDL